MSRTKVIVLRLAGAVFAPFIIFSFYLLISHNSEGSALSYYAAIAMSIVICVAFILTLPISLKARVPVAIASILVLAMFLPYYAVYFWGMVFGDWL